MTNQKKNIGVLGLGYVGLTLSITLAKSKFNVVGIENNKKILKKLKKGNAHFYEENIDIDFQRVLKKKKIILSEKISDLKNCDVIFITLGTPIDENKKVLLQNLFTTSKKLSKVIKKNCVVGLRSTVRLFTSKKIFNILNKYRPVHLAMCPERTIEGSALKEIYRLPQIIGSPSKQALQILSFIFRKISSKIIRFPTYEEAELLKLIDNSYRDVRFGFANELSRISEYYGIDVLNVIKNIKVKYPRTNVALPGIVGGPCLTKDSYILKDSVRKKINLPIIESARKTNSNFPLEIIEMIRKKMPFIESILICGLAFKGQPQTDDIRGSMSYPIIGHINLKFKIKPDLFDNLVSKKDISKKLKTNKFFKNHKDIKKRYDLILILNNNPFWKKVGKKNFKKILSKKGIIYDFWSSFNQNEFKEKKYFSYGSGSFGKLTK